MKMSKHKKGWALVRVSSTEQSNVQHGSLEQQNNRIQRWAEQVSESVGHSYQIVKSIEEARSGSKGKFHLREGFKQLLEVVRKREIDFIVFESVSRMGRWGRANAELAEACHDNGVELWFVDGGRFNYLNKGDRIKFGINNLMAEEESLDNSERVTKKQREAMVNNGKDTSTNPALGLDPHPTKVGMYIPNHEELKTVVEIMEKFCQYRSLKLTVNYCSERGFKTKERVTKAGTDKMGNIVPSRRIGGDDFDETRLRAMLCSPKYRGVNSFTDHFDQFPKLQNDKKIVRWEYAHFREHGQVISEELLKRVEDTLKMFEIHKPRSSKFGNVYLLSGGILKDHLGNSFYGSSAKSGKHLYYYNKVNDPDLSKSIKKEEIEEIVIGRLKHYLTNTEHFQKLISTSLKNHHLIEQSLQSEMSSLQKRSKELEHLINGFSETLRKVVLDHTNDIIQICRTLEEEKQKAVEETV
jgi:DNA invertase Pin-like site-specific DNA recombinase